MAGHDVTRETNLEWIKLLRDEIKFEHHSMSARLNAFVTSQSFLFAAFAISGLGEHQHHQAIMWFSHLVVPVIGILFSMLFSLAVSQGIARLFQLNSCLHDRMHEMDGTPMSDLVEDLCLPSLSSRKRTLLYPKWIPVICGLAWVYVGMLSVLCQIMS